MSIRRVMAAGAERLEFATRLLQRARLADATAGVWEAGDIQWWSRSARRSDDIATPMWLDQYGPVAAVLATDWASSWGIDLLRVPGAAPDLGEIWGGVRDVIKTVGHERCDALVREDDEDIVSRLLDAGFRPDSHAWEAWMDPADRQPVSEPPAGYRLVDRTETRVLSHPMVPRNGVEVEERLQRCSLYDPRLDLAVQTNDGSFAGYALFWADSVTRVGLVEPMRVEDSHARRGVARTMLTEGLDRLVKRGMTRLKVGFETDAARSLYVGAGFRPTAALRNYSNLGQT
jgi:predicted N-acetyltransferase YhbS